MAAYQLSLEHSTSSGFVSKLNINGQYEESTTVTECNNYYLSQYSLIAKYLSTGLHYFSITFHTGYSHTFTDCVHSYIGNTNVFAVYLPSQCSVRSVCPDSTLSYSTSWANTDLT